MRVTPDRLREITGRHQPSAQARWFKRHFGVDVDYDRQGPIITAAAFEALVMRKLGLASIQNTPLRPTVKLVRSAP